MTLLPYSPAYLLPEKPEEKRWLIEELWTDEAVGIIGGEPKCCKSFLALSLVVAVASARACFGRFTVQTPGTVLLFAAEDALHIVKRRLEGICESQNVDLSLLDIQVITSQRLRIDSEDEFKKLEATVREIQPKLLLLDPFVRLHRVDENSSGDIATLLEKLRYLQRTYHCAVTLVHHSKKGAFQARGGQALRGSSEFHAWGDSNLYLKRDKDGGFKLSVEHRAEKSTDGFLLHLNKEKPSPFLELEINPSPEKNSHAIELAVTNLVHHAERPLKFREIRESTKIRAEHLSRTLKALAQKGQIIHSSSGYAKP